MARWVGVCTSKGSVNFVAFEVPDDNSPMILVEDGDWRVQTGDRSSAYDVLYKQCSDYFEENEVDLVVIKASAVAGRGGATLGTLHGAEVRGVILAAAASMCEVKQLSKSHISRVYGDRKFDEYVADDKFWKDVTTGGKLRKMSRPAAMLLLAARN